MCTLRFTSITYQGSTSAAFWKEWSTSLEQLALYCWLLLKCSLTWVSYWVQVRGIHSFVRWQLAVDYARLFHVTSEINLSSFVLIWVLQWNGRYQIFSSSRDWSISICWATWLKRIFPADSWISKFKKVKAQFLYLSHSCWALALDP